MENIVWSLTLVGEYSEDDISVGLFSSPEKIQEYLLANARNALQSYGVQHQLVQFSVDDKRVVRATVEHYGKDDDMDFDLQEIEVYCARPELIDEPLAELLTKLSQR